MPQLKNNFFSALVVHICFILLPSMDTQDTSRWCSKNSAKPSTVILHEELRQHCSPTSWCFSMDLETKCEPKAWLLAWHIAHHIVPCWEMLHVGGIIWMSSFTFSKQERWGCEQNVLLPAPSAHVIQELWKNQNTLIFQVKHTLAITYFHPSTPQSINDQYIFEPTFR